MRTKWTKPSTEPRHHELPMKPNTPRTNALVQAIRRAGIDWHYSATRMAEFARTLEMEVDSKIQPHVVSDDKPADLIEAIMMHSATDGQDAMKVSFFGEAAGPVSKLEIAQVSNGVAARDGHDWRCNYCVITAQECVNGDSGCPYRKPKNNQAS